MANEHGKRKRCDSSVRRGIFLAMFELLVDQTTEDNGFGRGYAEVWERAAELGGDLIAFLENETPPRRLRA